MPDPAQSERAEGNHKMQNNTPKFPIKSQAPAPNTVLDAALDYARGGLQVFPLGPKSKKPLKGSTGFKDATVDPDQIAKWFENNPELNIGIATGPRSKIFVLDIDPRHQGNESIFELEKKHSKLPDTVSQKTGGGGDQLFFKYPDNGTEIKVSAGVIAPGLDIRGKGGYVVAPPSIHPDTGRAYCWDNDPEEYDYQPAPQWLLDLIVNGNGKKPSGPLQVPEKIPEGQRNTELTRHAGSLRRNGLGADEIEAALLKINKNRCDPPLPDKDVQAIAKSVSKYEPGKDRKRQKPSFSPESTGVGNTIPEFNLPGLASGFEKNYGDGIKYVKPWKRTFIFDDKIWVEDSTDEIFDHLRDFVSACLHAAVRRNDAKGLTYLQRFLKDHSHYEKLLKHIRTMPKIREEPSRFTGGRGLLALNNGVIDFRDGIFIFREHSREDFLTKKIDVDYDPNADCPRFKNFLKEIFLGDQKLIEYFLRILGYAFSGLNTEQIFVILYGQGCNGKSTLTNLIQKIMGIFATQADPSLLMVRKFEAHPTILSALYQKRVVCVSETSQTGKLNEAMIKLLTGGDPILMRNLYEKPFLAYPEHTVFLSSNYKPHITGKDEGLWRRIIIFPLDYTIPAGKMDFELGQKLLEEKSGILNLVLKGFNRWRNKPLKNAQPDQVKKAVKSYYAETDSISGFFESCIENNETAQTSFKDIKRAYQQCQESSGEEIISDKALSVELERRGFVKKRTKSGMKWCGIKIKSDLYTEKAATK